MKIIISIIAQINNMICIQEGVFSLINRFPLAVPKQAQAPSLNEDMSRTASSTTWTAVETAPPRLIQVDRKHSMGRRLETIEEESVESSSRVNTCNGKQPAFDLSSKPDFPKQFPSLVAR